MEQIKSIIKKYIKDNIKVSSRPSENLKSLTKITNYFSDLLRSTQDNITYELIDEILLENDVVNTLLTSIMNKYLPYIEENSLEELFTDEITCQVVEIYCDKNNIDISAKTIVAYEKLNAKTKQARKFKREKIFYFD